MPEQCPDCGRFLKNDLVTSLAQADAPCPKCGRALTAEMFGIVPAAASGRGRGRTGADPLAGWDEDGPAPDRAQIVIALEPDEALLAGIGGGILGALVLRERPGIGALLGAFAGMVAGGLVRQAFPRR